jgi:long-chain acyl-CoA synthetase
MTKKWFDSYQDGVPHDIDMNEYKSIVDVLENSFKDFKDKPAFHCMGKTLTFGEMDVLSQKFASFLQNNLGLEKGARVALMMPNILQYPVALFGILRAGMVAVNVNPLYTDRELEHQLNDSGAEAIIIFANSASILEKVKSKTKVKHIILTQIGDMLSFPKSLIVNFVIKNVKKMVPAFNLPGHIKFLDALALGDENKFKTETLSHDDIAFLQYTGGTTGVSKGAVLSHGNIVANMIQARAWIRNVITPGEEIIITPLPLYHIFSLTANCFIFSSVGALNVLITNPRDFDGFVKELGKWKFSAFTGVNTLFNALINHPEFKNLDFSNLKVTLGGGMAVQRAVAEKWKSINGQAVD